MRWNSCFQHYWYDDTLLLVDIQVSCGYGSCKSQISKSAAAMPNNKQRLGPEQTEAFETTIVLKHHLTMYWSFSLAGHCSFCPLLATALIRWAKMRSRKQCSFIADKRSPDKQTFLFGTVKQHRGTLEVICETPLLIIHKQ